MVLGRGYDMILLEEKDGDGNVLGRCDARCYDAAEPRCVCICGGKNHGLGVSKAILNAAEIKRERPELKPEWRGRVKLV